MLLAGFQEVRTGERFGRYFVDAYVPEVHMAFEADGLRWHDPARDAARDAWLLEEHGLPVVRFTEAELLKIGRANASY